MSGPSPPLSTMDASTATREEHVAATKLQATFRGLHTRKTYRALVINKEEVEREYDKALRERSRRMEEREEQKAMLRDLSASEVEDWYSQQEHNAAVVVQSGFRMLKSKLEVTRMRVEAASKQHKPIAVDPAAADILAASYEASFKGGTFDDASNGSTPFRQRTPKPVEQIVTGLKLRHGQKALGLGELSMDAYLEGRRKTDQLVNEYREFAGNSAAAEAARTEKRCLAEKSYRAQRAAAHGSLAELPLNATPEQFPDPVGADPKHTRRLHNDLLDAARAELKWWKPLVKLNKEQKVLDDREAERRKLGVKGTAELVNEALSVKA